MSSPPHTTSAVQLDATTSNGFTPNPADSPVTRAAVDLHRNGRTPVRLHGKAPNTSGWQMLRFASEAEVVVHFTEVVPGANLGMLTGDGVADVDLDCPEALSAADRVLTMTPRRSGRVSTPGSHRWYRLSSGGEAYEKFADVDKSVLLELRADSRHQTMIPPSVHPDTHEEVRWESSPVTEGHEIELDALGAECGALAVVCVLLRGTRWPRRQGSRHDAFLALAGGLLRGAPDDERLVVLTRRIIGALAHLSGDDQAGTRAAETVNSTRDKLRRGEKVTGWTTLGNQHLVGGEWTDDRTGEVHTFTGEDVQCLATRHAFTMRRYLGLAEPATSGPDSKDAPHIGPTESAESREARLAAVRAKYPPMDLGALVSPDRPPRRWAWDGVVPLGEHVSIVAPAGEGKSLLAQGLSVSMALGEREFIGRELNLPGKVLYLDQENSEDDYAERLPDLGVTPGNVARLANRLIVQHLLADLPGLDTKRGGDALVELLDAYLIGPDDLLVLDSTQRITEGDENSNDTMRGLYRHTSQRLKRRGVTVLRTDNTGWENKRERGASSKRDDVGMAWLLVPGKSGGTYTLQPRKRRPKGGSGIGSVPDTLPFRRVTVTRDGRDRLEFRPVTAEETMSDELRALLNDRRLLTKVEILARIAGPPTDPGTSDQLADGWSDSAVANAMRDVAKRQHHSPCPMIAWDDERKPIHGRAAVGGLLDEMAQAEWVENLAGSRQSGRASLWLARGPAGTAALALHGGGVCRCA